jgi:hypothetical protein
MARRESKSPTLEEIENRIEPDLESAFPTEDLSNANDFDLAWNEYFSEKEEILHSQRTKQRVFNAYNDKHGIKRHLANPVTIKQYKVKRKEKEYAVYRDKKGKFVSRKRFEIEREEQ